MVPRENIQRILELAVQAPSGDNAQPWRFEVRGDVIDLFNISGKDYSPYNFQERGSFFAHGAVIENAKIAAVAAGYGCDITLFPDASNNEHVASIKLYVFESQTSDSLIDCIPRRTTNRKPYQKKELSDRDFNMMAGAFCEIGFGEVSWLKTKERVADFAKTVSLSDRLIFEEKSIHDAIFTSIRWTTEEESERRGLYIKTLELPPPAQVLFKMMKNWKTLTFMNKFHISQFIAKQSAAVFASSSAIGMVTMSDADKESYVTAGMAFERLWLCATALGLSIQPVTALAYLAQRVKAGDVGELSSDHVAEITSAQDHINVLFGNPGSVVAMMFRIGYGPAPTAHSRKSLPQILYIS